MTCAVVDGRGRPLPLPHTPYQMTSSRPAVLAKGRTKRVENELLLPGDAKRRASPLAAHQPPQRQRGVRHGRALGR